MTERDSGNHERELGAGIDEPGLAAEQQASSAAGDVSATTDLSAIQADDALLDALGGSDPQLADELGDQELNSLLLAWRRDIDSEPMPELTDTDNALVTIRAAELARRNGGRLRRRRMLVPVAAAAAVLAIGFTGTALAARDAQPGDTLWGLSKVLYSDHARSVEAAASVRTELQEASLAIAQQRFDDARRALREAQDALAQVAAGEELAQLRARHTELMEQLEPAQPEQQQSATTTPDTSSATGSPAPSTSSVQPAPEIPPSQADPTTTSTPTPSTTTSTPSPSTSTSTGTGTGTQPDGGAPLGASVDDPASSSQG